ncbi:MAG: 50S ribosomal protein L24 [Candidatus Woesearchaeota archaeon]
MKNKFSKKWNSSKKPNKQRKFRFNAPLHIKGKFLNAHLSKELRKKYNKRSLRIRVGDKVRILRGQFKKQEGKVEEVDVKKSIIYVSKIEHIKRDGTKARYPIQPSNVMLIELAEEKKRFKNKNTKEKATKNKDDKKDGKEKK